MPPPKGDRFHYCPTHGWERCLFIFDYGHGCVKGLSLFWIGGRTKTVEMN